MTPPPPRRQHAQTFSPPPTCKRRPKSTGDTPVAPVPHSVAALPVPDERTPSSPQRGAANPAQGAAAERRSPGKRGAGIRRAPTGRTHRLAHASRRFPAGCSAAAVGPKLAGNVGRRFQLAPPSIASSLPSALCRRGANWAATHRQTQAPLSVGLLDLAFRHSPAARRIQAACDGASQLGCGGQPTRDSAPIVSRTFCEGGDPPGPHRNHRRPTRIGLSQQARLAPDAPLVGDAKSILSRSRLAFSRAQRGSIKLRRPSAPRRRSG